MRQIAREKKKNKLFKTDLGVSKRFLKGRSRKGKGEISSSFSNRCAFLSKRRAQVVDFFPAGVYNGSIRCKRLRKPKIVARGAGVAAAKKTENGENALRAGGRTRKCVVAVRRSLRAGDERKATKRRLESRRMDGRTLRAPAFAFAGKRKRLKKPPVPGKKKMEKKR